MSEKCKNCGHEIEKDRDSYGGWRHIKERPKYFGAPSYCFNKIGRYRENCGCSNAEPEKEAKKKNQVSKK